MGIFTLKKNGGRRAYAPDQQKVSSVLIFLSIVELALLAVTLAQAVLDTDPVLSFERLPALIALAALVVFDVASAVFAYHSALRQREDVRSLSQSLRMVEQLNATLRAQRHDFLNHLQVVSGLLQMDACDEAVDYLGRITDDVRVISAVLRTKNPALNALIRAKSLMCTKRGLAFLTDVDPELDRLPIEDWQMCRVLSNLIDNAAEAAGGDAARPGVIRLVLGQDAERVFFRVENNGPAVPAAIVRDIFSPGFSTKGEGRGMGLFIVRETLREKGGDVACGRSGEWTVFSGEVPKIPGGGTPDAANAAEA